MSENIPQHTPGPWHVEKSQHGLEWNAWIESQGGCVAGCTIQADAEYICRAVNAHDALVEALKRALVEVNATNQQRGDLMARVSLSSTIRAALTLAKGGAV